MCPHHRQWQNQISTRWVESIQSVTFLHSRNNFFLYCRLGISPNLVEALYLPLHGVLFVLLAPHFFVALWSSLPLLSRLVVHSVPFHLAPKRNHPTSQVVVSIA